MADLKHTPLFEAHVAAGGRMVDFAGWEMPLHYGSQIDEHHAVRRAVGIFDVSHMGVIDLSGVRVREMLRYLCANDVERIDATPGKALYTCMLNPQGGVIDDLIVYQMDRLWYRLVVNAATRAKDVEWLTRHARDYLVQVQEQDEVAMVAVQGPHARGLVHQLLGSTSDSVAMLGRFQAVHVGSTFIARTGYSGEDGYELILPVDEAGEWWERLIAGGACPCGLGARDTLRLEAGMALYGQDMSEEHGPLVSGLGWSVAWEPVERDFVGREALHQQREIGATQRFVGLVLEEKGVLRAHQRVVTSGGTGEITSGSFSPTLGRAIALARIPAGDEEQCEVEIRERRLRARIVRPPFVRNGRVLVELPHT